MTSPPTSSGWQVVSDDDAPHRSHDRTSSPASPWLNERLSRTAMQDRGRASTRASASGEPSMIGVLASRRSALLLRFSTVMVESGIVRSRCVLRSRCASAWLSEAWMASPKRPCSLRREVARRSADRAR